MKSVVNFLLTICLLLAFFPRPSVEAHSVVIPLRYYQGIPTGAFASSTGTSGGNGSIDSPWDLQTAMGKSATQIENATDNTQHNRIIYVRGGTYPGKFNSSLTGAAGNYITVRSYPGEWAVIEGFQTTTLTAAANSSQTSITVASTAGFRANNDITFHDGVEGVEEEAFVQTVNSSTQLTILRGRNGTSAASHSSGATIVAGGNQVNVTGDYTIYRDLEIQNSDPTRIQSAADTQNAPHQRGESFFVTGDFNKFVNLVIHDLQDGFFNSQSASGTEIYGCIIYNNGYLAGGAYNGHGLYFIHEDTLNQALIKECIVFNNSNDGIKGDSQSNDCRNIRVEGCVSFHTGNWSGGANTKWNLLLSSNSGVAGDIVVNNNFLYNPGTVGESLRVGRGESDNQAATVTNNYIGGGQTAVDIDKCTPLVFTGNTVHLEGSDQGIFIQLATGQSKTWDNNTYWNQRSGTTGYFYGAGSSNLNFSQWKTNCGCDAAATQTTGEPSSDWVFVRANAYDTNQANVVIYNWDDSTTQVVDVSSVFQDGDQIAIHSAEAGTFPDGTPLATAIVAGGTITVVTTAGNVAPQIGANGSTIVTTSSRWPEFGVLRLIRIPQAGGGNPPRAAAPSRAASSGRATASGRASASSRAQSN